MTNKQIILDWLMLAPVGMPLNEYEKDTDDEVCSIIMKMSMNELHCIKKKWLVKALFWKEREEKKQSQIF